MRHIVNSTFVSLDGVVNHMEKWHFEYIDAESEALALEQMQAADALLMGRATYDVYASAWPDRDGPVADRCNEMPKYVVSSTLQDPTWQNTTVISDRPLERIAELREQDGGPLLMQGYGRLAKALLAAGLLDELHLWVNPALAGAGAAGDLLLEPGLNVHLRHSGTRTLGSGVVVLSYAADGDGAVNGA